MSELKDEIFKLEDATNTLSQHVRNKDYDVTKLKEDKRKLDEEIKEVRVIFFMSSIKQ